MTYTIEREDAAEDARVLRAAINVARSFVSDDADAMIRLGALADSIEEQVKPLVEEPKAWGSIVLGRTCGTERCHWQRNSEGVWYSEYGAVCEAWSYFQADVEVLRVGIREPSDEQQAARKYGTTVALGEAYSRGYHQGVEWNYTKAADDFAAKVRRELAALRSTVITGPEKRTCDDALALVAALLGES